MTYETYRGKDHINSARVLNTLGNLYLTSDPISLQTAESYFLESLKIFQRNKHPDAYITLENLADLYVKKAANEKEKGNEPLSQDSLNKAHSYFREARGILEKLFPSDSPHLLRVNQKINASPK